MLRRKRQTEKTLLSGIVLSSQPGIRLHQSQVCFKVIGISLQHRLEMRQAGLDVSVLDQVSSKCKLPDRQGRVLLDGLCRVGQCTSEIPSNPRVHASME